MATRQRHPLLAKPLYVFALPPELLDTLVLRRSSAQTVEKLNSEEEQETPTRTSDYTKGDATGDNFRACQACGDVHFSTVEEQRRHAKTDWHRYNLKRQLLNQGKPVSEREFEELIADLTDSISGSDRENSSEDEQEERIEHLLRKTTIDEESEEESVSKSIFARFPLLWFESQHLQNTQLGIYRTLFRSIDGDDIISMLKGVQIRDNADKRCWTLLMVGGGHFAAMVVKLQPKIVHKERQVEVIAHKTFHRYTTRRKQGGAQSANDGAKGAAKSAGSNLRRYNEATLTDEIRDLMDKWREYLDDSEMIFIRANGNNRRILFGYDDAPLIRSDARVRSFPFMTRRPTHNELMRCFVELTRVKISHFTEEAMQQHEAELLSKTQSKPKIIKQQPQPVAVPKAPKPVITKEQESQRQAVRKLVDLCRKGKLDLLTAHMSRYGYSAGVMLVKDDQDAPDGVDILDDSPTSRLTPTLLHLAAASGHADIVAHLLEDPESDPTVQNATHRTAYEMCVDRFTRNAFRRAMAANTTRCDWVRDARVPSALTKEMEEEQTDKKAEWRRKERERKRDDEQRKEEESRIEKQQEDEARALEAAKKKPSTPKVTSGPQKLGGGVSATKQVINSAGLSDEMKMRIEREKRLRALEARMKK